MFAKIRSKTRWRLEPALAALAALVFLPARLSAAEGETIRLYFDFESQSFAVRVTDGQAEAISCHGGRVLRRGVGAVTAPFQRALAAVEKAPGRERRPLTVSREELVERDFFVIVHPRFTLGGASHGAGPGISELLEAARTLAMELPEAELAGLYLQAFPSSGPERGEPVVAAAESAKLAALLAAFTAAPFAVRVSDAQLHSALPRESMFSALAPGGQWYLVSYLQGAPFSLADWLRK